MEDVHSIPLFEDTTAWLLNSHTPSIRYLTLTALLGKAETDDAVTSARALISSCPPVTKIWSAQNEDGSWADPRHIYSPKYRSSHWTMLLLTELGVDPRDVRMQKGSHFMQRRIQEDNPQYLRRTEAGFGCFWGNFLRYQLYCGRGDQAFTRQVIEFVCEDIQRGGRCRYNSNLPCAWSVVREVYGLAQIPAAERSERVRAAIATGIRFIMDDYDLLTVNYPADHHPHELWEKMSFPIFYHADRLFVLRALKAAGGLGHPNAHKVKDWLMNKRTQAGIWRGGSPFSSSTRPFLIKPDTVDRWITLQALTVLSPADGC